MSLTNNFFHVLTSKSKFLIMCREGKAVCVTGASGYVASWLVKLLLDRGYIVHATVRLLCDPSKTEHLLALDGAKERLSLYEANLSVDGSFDSAVNGCVCVFHTASPVILTSVDDPQAQLIYPAVKGTLNVLKSAAKVQSIKKVVLTSSMAAVVFGSTLPVHGDVIDETWFLDPDICDKRKMWYSLSKTLAEDAAVNFAKDNGLDLVVINPGYVIGPILQPTLNHTSDGILRMLKDGKDLFPGAMYLLVDVRDVAVAHILAFENPGAKGRYCMVGKAAPHLEIMNIVNKLYPSLGHSKRRKDGEFVEPLPYYVSRAKAESLGVKFTPLEVSIKDIVESLKEKNLLSF
ncbi:phenylacetaldehyde reductase-like [Bidens hawaiensis]|uniref:phenylacetaldehyde reductase-like n=1 Tax=Bidens hawaiensis TaxID=980011 RepID=UPI00404A0DD1